MKMWVANVDDDECSDYEDEELGVGCHGNSKRERRNELGNMDVSLLPCNHS